jgi:DNA polymerase (family 10)
MSRNHEVANVLFEVAEGLQAQGERGFRVMAYGRAAQRIARMPEDVEVLCDMGRLHDIEGVGESIAAKVEEYLRSGSLGYLRQVRGQIPEPVKSLMAIRGIGPERARMIWQALEVGTLDELARAAAAHQLRRLPGIGETLEAQVIRELERIGVAEPATQGGAAQQLLFPSPPDEQAAARARRPA